MPEQLVALSSDCPRLVARAAMPMQRAEQAGIPIYVMPNGDTAGARGAALEAFRLARTGVPR